MDAITTCTMPEVIGMAKHAGLDEVEDRISYLYNLLLENDADQMNPDSKVPRIFF